MLDISYIRRFPNKIRDLLQKRALSMDLDRFIHLDEDLRILQKEIDDLSHKKNQLKKENLKEEPLKKQYGQLQRNLRKREKIYRESRKEWEKTLVRFPNQFLEGSPYSPSAQVETLFSSPLRELDFSPKSYIALGSARDLFSLEKGSDLSGPLSVVYHHMGARLVRALKNFMLDVHTGESYREVSIPLLVKRNVAFQSGHLPRFEGDMFSTEKNQLFLIPTSEVPLASLHQGEILSPKILPIKYVCASPCFRREKGAKAEGLFRTHSFEKVELFQFTRPDDSARAFEEILEGAKKILELLELPYRMVKLSYAELAFSAACAVDLEVWCPAQQQFLEVSTISNCLDFQARRAKTRFRSGPKKTGLVHTLNGSGVALPRLLISILENYQREDGKIGVPEVLKPYLRCEVI